MPYEIVKRGSQYCVVKQGGDTIACHKTKAQALEQQKALYANEKAEEMMERVALRFDATRKFSSKERDKLAGKQALKDGSFPIKTVQDLKNAIRAYGRAKNKARAKAHIIRRAKALKATNLLPADWAGRVGKDVAHQMGWLDCPEDDCGRTFLNEDLLADHAEAVHTFNDIERLVNDAVKEKYSGGTSDNRIYAWITDMSTDWVVFTVEGNTQVDMFKASYGITDGTVTLGEPVEVRRKTVYEPVKKDS